MSCTRRAGGVVLFFCNRAATVELTKSLVVLDESYYPESMEKLFIINAPWIFNATWKLLKPLISERTLAKITICGADYYEKLVEVIDEDQIPAEFGGETARATGPGSTHTD